MSSHAFLQVVKVTAAVAVSTFVFINVGSWVVCGHDVHHGSTVGSLPIEDWYVSDCCFCLLFILAEFLMANCETK